MLPIVTGIIILLLFSGYFSASETALMSLSRAEVKRMSQGSMPERLACQLLQKPQSLLGTILIGNMFVNVLLAGLFATFLDSVLTVDGQPAFQVLAAKLFPNLGPAGLKRFSDTCNALLNVLLVTPLLMVFGEQTPKVLAYSSSTSIASKSAPFLTLLCKVLKPINQVLHTLGNAMLTILGQGKMENMDDMTTEELLATISVGQESGATNDEEQNILSRIVGLGDIDVKEVMTHRMDVVGIEDSLTLGEAYEFAKRKRHSWYPIYHESLDDAWGLLSLMDFPHWNGTHEMDMTLEEFHDRLGDSTRKSPVYQPHFVPEYTRIDKLLHTMRQEAFTVAIVVDEHGGTFGMATQNDLIEEMLGRFGDDEDEDALHVRNDGIAFANGRAHLRVLQKTYGDFYEEDEEGDADTIGGFIMEQLGHIPKPGEELVLDNGVTLRVHRMIARRIRTVEITPAPPKNGEDEE